MKAGILTFHASHNYGSMLQAYALQKVLSKYGVDSEVINFRSEIQKSLIPPSISFGHPRTSLSKIVRNPVKTFQLQRKFRRFERFLRDDLMVSPEISNSKEIPDYIRQNGFDAMITGSDQIWNFGCWDFDMCYMLDFSFDGRRIAYAPSMGSHPEEISEADLDKLRRAVSKYDFISTREERGSCLISELVGRDVSTVLDPTLLLDRCDYEELTKKDFDITTPYMLYYTPREERGWFDKAKELAQTMNLKIVVTQDFPDYKGDNVYMKLDCGPKEFLSVIKNAKLCVGDSFHLLAFSIIFEKDFYLFSKVRDSRMINLLDPLKLGSRLIVGNTPVTVCDDIDYSIVKRKLVELRQGSLDYLKSSIS